ncbi:unnamed protein product [Echinostoma caproni]|uniref:Peptidase A2 domain-containing protein n=1 Tax=Echinostoma caproni TaxID=27848 RepID=A0A183ALA2_9TREM|nr:unnamed protein product [Echinostoma caproni]
MRETQLPAPQKPSVCLLSQSAGKQLRLGVTQVGILSPSGVVKAMELIENGSDATLITKRFAVNRNRDTVPTRPVRGAVAMKDGVQPIAEQSRDNPKMVRVP